VRTAISIIYFIAALFFALFASRCGLKYPADFIKDPAYTPECKISVLQGYYMQKAVDKSALVELTKSCKESNRFTRCEKHINDRTLFAECKELLK
jgi:predicted small lipoprotein YifL